MQNGKDFKHIGRHNITHFFLFHKFSLTPRKDMPDSNLIKNVKFKYSPQKKNLNKYHRVFVKEFKFGLLSLQLKKGNYSFI